MSDESFIGRLTASIALADRQRGKDANLKQAAATLDRVIAELLSNRSYAALAARILKSDRPLDAAELAKISPDDRALLKVHAQACRTYSGVFSDDDQYEDAEHRIRQFQSLSQAAGEKDEGIMAVTLAGIHRRQGKYGQAITEFKQCIEIFRARGDNAGLNREAYTLGSMSHAYAALGQIPEAFDCIKRALDIAEESLKPIDAAIFRGTLAQDYYLQGNVAEAEKECRRALEVLLKEHPRGADYCYKILGDILVAQDKIPEAREAYVKATESTILHCKAMGNVGLGWWELRFGNPEAAAKAFAVVGDPELKDEALKTEALAGLALAQLRQGNMPEAQETFRNALLHDYTPENRYVQGHILAAQAALMRVMRKPEAAATARSSDDAFRAAAVPLVGLSEKLSSQMGPIRATDSAAR